MTTVGAFEAKTNLNALLKKVARGETIQITLRGVLVAKLVPASSDEPEDPQGVVRDIRKLCEAGPRGPAKYRAHKRHLGLLNGERLPERGSSTAPVLRLVE